jgi:hypothetical protein
MESVIFEKENIPRRLEDQKLIKLLKLAVKVIIC